MKKLLIAFCAAIAALCTTPATAAQLLVNGGFEAGLTGWTSYTTTGGTISPTLPNSLGSPVNAQNAEVSSFNTNGAGASNALWLNAGQYDNLPFGFGHEAGGGVMQVFTSAAGSATFSADIAAFTVLNQVGGDGGGLFTVLLDGVQVGSFDFGSIAQGTTRSSISFTTDLTAGEHMLSLQVVRPFGPAKNIRSQYWDNVSLDLAPTAAVPEPATWAMMIVGFAMIGATLRRRSTAVSFA